MAGGGHDASALTNVINESLGSHIPDFVVMTVFVMVLTLVVGLFVRMRLSMDKPGILQQIGELWVEFINNLLEQVVGHGAKQYSPMIFMFSVFILIGNLLGMVPTFLPPTQYVIVTLSLGVCSFIIYNYYGIKAIKWGYMSHFTGPILILAPLFIPIELVSHSARPISLGVRLFGNIAGEHMSASVFMGILPLGMPAALMALGLLAAFVQTFIFVMLSVVYIAMGVDHH